MECFSIIICAEDIMNLAYSSLCCRCVHRECFSCGVSDSFQSLWTEWNEATLHGTLFIRHDVDWKYSLTEVVRRACCFDLSLSQALACV
jgi:hypothetical protein